MKLKVITPERVVLDEDNVTEVYAKAVDGEVGILPRHIPLVTPLEISTLRYVQNGQKQTIAVMGGLLQTDGQSISILSDAAERANEIDITRAEKARERAEKEDLKEEQVRLALARSLARLKAGRG